MNESRLMAAERRGMELSEEQKRTVAEWLAAGAGVAEIQKRISSEFNIDMTYLDVRLLVADLPQPVEPEPAKEADVPPAGGQDETVPGAGYPEMADSAGAAGQDYPPEDQGSSPIDQDDPGAGQDVPGSQDGEGVPGEASLSVSVDPLAPPGMIACGSVVFSDGTAGKWALDQMGRLGLSGLPEGYRPSPEDGAQFQPRLVAALRAKGLV